jgi:hypothetical protein
MGSSTAGTELKGFGQDFCFPFPESPPMSRGTPLWKPRSTASRGRWTIDWTSGWTMRTSRYRRWQRGRCEFRLHHPFASAGILAVASRWFKTWDWESIMIYSPTLKNLCACSQNRAVRLVANIWSEESAWSNSKCLSFRRKISSLCSLRNWFISSFLQRTPSA